MRIKEHGSTPKASNSQTMQRKPKECLIILIINYYYVNNYNYNKYFIVIK